MKVFPVVMLGALVLAGCTADYATRSTSPVILLITGVNDGDVLSSDVLISTGGVCPDIVPVRLENHSVSPIAPTIDWRADIVIERYEVRYSRSDGRGVEGVDVPYSISGNMAFEVIYRSALNVNIEVVRRQAKLEPPLSNLIDNGKVVTMFAEVTLHGKTNAGKTSVATGRMQIDFANFGDTLTACEP